MKVFMATEGSGHFAGDKKCYKVLVNVAGTNMSSYHSYRPISDSHISQVVALHECLNTNSLGQLWTSSMPFLYPFIVQFR
jgi:hypothetical protein